MASSSAATLPKRKNVSAKPLNALRVATRNPYDGEAYYNLGLCLRYLDRDDEALRCILQGDMESGLVRGRVITRWRKLTARGKNWATAPGSSGSFAAFWTRNNLRARNLKSPWALRMCDHESEAARLLGEKPRARPARLVGAVG